MLTQYTARALNRYLQKPGGSLCKLVVYSLTARVCLGNTSGFDATKLKQWRAQGERNASRQRLMERKSENADTSICSLFRVIRDCAAKVVVCLTTGNN